MREQLYKEGKRKCHVCKVIKPLDENFFHRTNKKGKRGFRYNCKKCKTSSGNQYKYNQYRFRYKLIIEKGNKCEICGIENENTTFFDVDHIDRNKKVSGRNSAFPIERDNLQVLCPNCHRLKGIRLGEVGRKKVLQK